MSKRTLLLFALAAVLAIPLIGRGLLRPGMAADIVIFDEKTVADRATFEQPKQFAAGIGFVLVNGQIVIESARHTGAKPGKILRGQGVGN